MPTRSSVVSLWALLPAAALACSFPRRSGGRPDAPAEPGASASAAMASAGSTGVHGSVAAASADLRSLAERRKAFRTRIVRDPRGADAKVTTPPPKPPSGMFRLVKYRSGALDLWAYVTPPPKTKGRRPAIVWVGGGFSSALDAGSFTEGPSDNDQSAAAFRKAGLVLVLPSFRGGNDNPGQYEELYGEVDDLIAALEHTRQLPYVDPERVYLGGHSTGATMVLLASELTDRFRAAFAFGPVEAAESYGPEVAPFDRKAPSAAEEWALRAPILHLRDIRRPVTILEGQEHGNAESAELLAEAAHLARAPVTVHVLPWGDHFSILRTMTERLAEKIEGDGRIGASSIRFDAADLAP